MNRFEECEAARDIISEFEESHRWRARHIASIGIERYMTDAEPPILDMRVAVGLTGGTIPPKFSAVIDRMLDEVELHIPVRYYRMTSPKAIS